MKTLTDILSLLSKFNNDGFAHYDVSYIHYHLNIYDYGGISLSAGDDSGWEMGDISDLDDVYNQLMNWYTNYTSEWEISWTIYKERQNR